jgi:hypothetical protein
MAAPVWQTLHGTPAAYVTWFAGLPASAPSQLIVDVWQEMQSSAVTVWPALFPGALDPSWHPMQIPEGEGLS